MNCEILTKPAADKLRQDLEAAAIGNRLLHDRRGPIELYAARDFAPTQPQTSWEDNPDDPDHPTTLIRRLTATVSGCEWLRGQWRRLRDILKLGLHFQSHEKFRMIRLMGHQPINAVSVLDVARVFLACHVLGPQFSYAFEELRCEMLDSQFKNHKKLLERWNKIAITPESRTAARAVLLGIIDEATERLRVVEAELQERADKVARQEQARLGQEDGKAGEQLRRHLGSCNRLIFGNIDAIHRFRRNEADGWGRARQERQARRAENAGRKNREDEPLVVDERGTVRPARGYKGNLEEGLARYQAQFGRSGLDRPAGSRSEIEETHVRAVPDFARWKPPVEDGGVGGDATALVDPANTPLDRGCATALVDPANTPLDRGCATALVDPANTPLDRGDATALVDPANTPLDRGCATALVDPANTPLDRGDATALVDPAPTPPGPPFARGGEEVLSNLLPGDGRGDEVGLGGAVTLMLTEADSQSNIQNEIGGAGLEEAGGSTADEDEGGVGERKEGESDRSDGSDGSDRSAGRTWCGDAGGGRRRGGELRWG